MLEITKEPNPLMRCLHLVYAMNYLLDKLDPIAKILLSPNVKKRMEKEFLHAYDGTYTKFTAKGYQPKFHKIDSESSKAIAEFIAGKQTTL